MLAATERQFHAGHQAKGRAVGEARRLRLAVKDDQHLHRAENFLLRKRVVGGLVAEQRGPRTAAATRCIGAEVTGAMSRSAVAGPMRKAR